MKSILRILKNISYFMVASYFVIVSCAAVVSDNDGAAFITKAEFDSLKNNFQSKIDEFNTTIDNKLSDTISSYLSGVKVSKTITYPVEISSWETLKCTNYPLEQKWTLPNINLAFAFAFSGYNTRGDWWEAWWAISSFNYDRPASTRQVRNVVDAGEESSTNTLPDKVTWVGQALDYEDTIVGSKFGSCPPIVGTSNHAPSYMGGAQSGTLAVIRALALSTGYIGNKAINDAWTAGVYWYGTEGTSFRYELKPSNWVTLTLNTSVILNYVDEKQYDNTHILSWDNYNWPQLSDPDWTQTFGNNPSYTQQATVATTSVIKKGIEGLFEINDALQTKGAWVDNISYTQATTTSGNVTHRPVSKTVTDYYSGNYGSSVTTPMQSVGVLNKTYNSTTINQWANNLKIKRDNSKTLLPLNLCQGAIIGYAKKGETFEWEPVISGTYKTSASATSSTKVPKWRVKLSREPFTTKDSLANASNVLKNKDQTTDYLETDSDGKCKFKIEKLSEDSYIYCKWWPADSTICNTYLWDGILDLTNCSKYVITEAS